MKKKRKRNLVPEWGRLIHRLWDWCAMRDNSFGDTCAGGLQAHHLISRSRKGFRADPRNGILLCCKHHTFSKVVSPHGNPVAFSAELCRMYPRIFEWVVANSNGSGSTEDEQKDMIDATVRAIELKGNRIAWDTLWSSGSWDVLDFPVGDGCRAKSARSSHPRVAMEPQELKRSVLAVAKAAGKRVRGWFSDDSRKRNARTPGLRSTRSKEEIKSGWGLHVQ